jgi:hypothetical protein
MGEYEPHDSRNVTLNPDRAPGEPPRTGPRDGRVRQAQAELEQDERGEEAEATVEQTGAGQMGEADAEAEAALRERTMERDADAFEGPERFDRND